MITIPHPGDFAHRSQIHGQAHVARVMVHAMRLIDATGWEHERTRLWAAVYLHELARTHDGRCEVHGAQAVARWHASPTLQTVLADGGVRDTDHAAIARAVTLHSRPDRHEPARQDADWPLVALLKDADALDRVRINDLNPAFLRLPQSHGMIDFAEQLFLNTDHVLTPGPRYFAELIEEVDLL